MPLDNPSDRPLFRGFGPPGFGLSYLGFLSPLLSCFNPCATCTPAPRPFCPVLCPLGLPIRSFSLAAFALVAEEKGRSGGCGANFVERGNGQTGKISEISQVALSLFWRNIGQFRGRIKETSVGFVPGTEDIPNTRFGAIGKYNYLCRSLTIEF